MKTPQCMHPLRCFGFGTMLLVAAVFSENNDQTRCSDGRTFGDECQFECHCKGGDQKCAVGDHCEGNCEAGWFGRSCQYAAAVYSVTPKTLTSALMDDDNSTCIDDNSMYIGGAYSLQIRLVKPQQFTWLRATIHNASDVNSTPPHLDLYSLEGDVLEHINCTPTFYMNDAERYFDMFCSTYTNIDNFLLSGDVIQSLCSLRVSAGRNVAYKQQAKFSAGVENWAASQAVDGQYPGLGIPPAQACASTEQSSGPSVFKLTFKRTVRAYSLVLQGLKEQRQNDSLDGLRLNLLDEHGEIIFSYNVSNNGADYGAVNNITIKQPAMADSIQITKPLIRNVKNSLTICEVVIFGEVLCPSGRYGLNCELQCHCRLTNETCFVPTGACPSGCSSGYMPMDCGRKCSSQTYGQDCSKKCSSACKNKICDHVTGICESNLNADRIHLPIIIGLLSGIICFICAACFVFIGANIRNNIDGEEWHFTFNQFLGEPKGEDFRQPPGQDSSRSTSVSHEENVRFFLQNVLTLKQSERGASNCSLDQPSQSSTRVGADTRSLSMKSLNIPNITTESSVDLPAYKIPSRM